MNALHLAALATATMAAPFAAFGADVAPRIDTEIQLAQYNLGAEVASGRIDNESLMDEWRLRRDAEYAKELIQRHGLKPQGYRADADPTKLRLDAIDQGTALGFPRQFLHMISPPLQEVRKPLNGMRLFQIDNSVPLGAKFYGVQREFLTGEAVITSGSNSDIPVVGATAREELRPIVYLATSWAQNFLQQLSMNFAGINDTAAKRRAVRRAMDELVNRLIWYGSAPHDVYGVLTHPDLAKVVASLAFVAGADTDDVIAELHRLANYSWLNSGQTFKPNRAVTTARLRSYLFQTRIGSTTDTTVGQHFIENSEFIKQIETANELEGIGPNGEDAILFYNDDRDSLSIVIPQDMSELPAQRIAFDEKTICWMPFGGARMNNVGNNLLAYVPVS